MSGLDTQRLSNAIDGVRVIMNDENTTDIQCDITSPRGTPYESGVFIMKLALGADFPTAPPKAYFEEGEICVNTLKKDWSPNLGIKHIITVIRCLLIDPNPESVLNEEAGRLLLDKYEDFAQHAKLMTEIHAKSMAGGDSDCKEAGAAPPGPSAAKKRTTEKRKSERKKSLKRLQNHHLLVALCDME
jgi:ubiquitin-conjugating enzyme E2 S